MIFPFSRITICVQIRNVHDHSCSKQECSICPLITCEISNATYIRTDRRNNCETSNVIYGLNCVECNKIVYVGETERSAGERVKDDIADIRHRREKTVAAHHNSGNHKIQDLKEIILERCRNNSRYYRKTRESFWIDRLNTIAPNGANQQTKGILWPDYIVERNGAQDVRAMTSQQRTAKPSTTT